MERNDDARAMHLKITSQSVRGGADVSFQNTYNCQKPQIKINEKEEEKQQKRYIILFFAFWFHPAFSLEFFFALSCDLFFICQKKKRTFSQRHTRIRLAGGGEKPRLYRAFFSLSLSLSTNRADNWDSGWGDKYNF